MRGNVKQIIRFSIKEIMEAGAMGTEIRVAGKIVGKGGKAKTLNVRAGYLKKAGEQAKKVQEGHYTAYLKAGAIGVRVRIVPPGTVFSDQLSKPEIKEEKPGEGEAAPAEEKAAPETEQVIEKKLEEAKQEKVKTIRKKRAAKKKEKTEGE